MYIGKQPTIGNFQVCDAISVVNGQAAYTMQVSSSNVEPESANHMLVSLNGIIQKPGSSFTISGATITFASNLVTNDVIDFVMLLGNVLDLGTPSDGTVTNAKLAQDIISAETALGVAPADTDEFLVSDAGTLKRIDYSLIKGGGQWEKLVTTTASSTTAVEFDSTYITSSHRDYCVVISDFTISADAMPQLLFSVDDGDNYLTATNYKYAMRCFKSDASTNHNADANDTVMKLAGDNVDANSANSSNLIVMIWNPLSTSTQATISVTGQIHTPDDLSCGLYGGGAYVSGTGATNAVKFNLSTGNYATGTFTLYGRAI